jgi:hypothetical protein
MQTMGSSRLILVEILLVIFYACNVKIITTSCQEIVSVFRDYLVNKVRDLKNQTKILRSSQASTMLFRFNVVCCKIKILLNK